MSDPVKYSLIWKQCGRNSYISKRFYVPGFEGYLPFLVWGDELYALERRQEVELREEHLLKGILYGLYEIDHCPQPWNNDQGKETYLYLLDVLGNGFHFQSPEKMVLDVAYDLREKHGNELSSRILLVGCKLIPQSSKIKSDLVMDLWLLRKGKTDTNMLNQIVDLVNNIDPDEINEDAREIIFYNGLHAIILLRKCDQVDSFLVKYIYPYVQSSDLKQKIKMLLERRDEHDDILF